MVFSGALQFVNSVSWLLIGLVTFLRGLGAPAIAAGVGVWATLTCMLGMAWLWVMGAAISGLGSRYESPADARNRSRRWENMNEKKSVAGGYPDPHASERDRLVAFAQQGGGSDGDKFIFGQSYVLRSGETLSGNLAILGGDATLESGSTVNGDIAVAGGKLTLAGTVRGSVAVFGGATFLQESAVIRGDFASFGGAIERAPGATIMGQILGGSDPRVGPLSSRPYAFGSFLSPQSGVFGGFNRIVSWELGTLGAAILMVLLGLLAVLIAPKALGRMATAAATQPAFSFGVGLLTVVVALLAGGLLLIACCTGLFVWLALAVALLVGWIAVGLWLGQRLLAALKVRTASSLAEVAVGVFLITFLGRLPWCLGFLFSAIVGCIGLGAVVLTRFGTQPADGSIAAPKSEPPASLAVDEKLTTGEAPAGPVDAIMVQPEPPAPPAVVELDNVPVNEGPQSESSQPSAELSVPERTQPE